METWPWESFTGKHGLCSFEHYPGDREFYSMDFRYSRFISKVEINARHCSK